MLHKLSTEGWTASIYTTNGEKKKQKTKQNTPRTNEALIVDPEWSTSSALVQKKFFQSLTAYVITQARELRALFLLTGS